MAPTTNASNVIAASEHGRGWRLRVGLHSERGLREKNDDYGNWLDSEDVFALADGIGGAPYGDVMARVAVNGALAGWHTGVGNAAAGRGDDRPSEALERTRVMFEHAEALVADTKALLDEGGCGTTLVTAARVADAFAVGSVGDTAAYRLRAGVLERLNPLGRAGVGTNALASALGGRQAADPALWEDTLADGDVFLLATDGIWAHTSENEIARVLADGAPNAPRMAHDLAVSVAWRDNATALVIVVEKAKGDDA